jgi:hypothetical protein
MQPCNAIKVLLIAAVAQYSQIGHAQQLLRNGLIGVQLGESFAAATPKVRDTWPKADIVCSKNETFKDLVECSATDPSGSAMPLYGGSVFRVMLNFERDSLYNIVLWFTGAEAGAIFDSLIRRTADETSMPPIYGRGARGGEELVWRADGYKVILSKRGAGNTFYQYSRSVSQ